MPHLANTIRELPLDERPRERLLSRGAVSLSDAELIDAQGKRLGTSLWSHFGFGRLLRRGFRRGHAFPILLRAPRVTGCTMAIRARWKALLLPVPAPWSHDEWIAFLLSMVSRLIPVPEKEPLTGTLRRCNRRGIASVPVRGSFSGRDLP